MLTDDIVDKLVELNKNEPFFENEAISGGDTHSGSREEPVETLLEKIIRDPDGGDSAGA